MTIQITITCPITWHARCTWLTDHCPGRVDNTNWGMWQVGLDNVYFAVDDDVALLYYLVWGT